MANYKETTSTGTSWIRSNLITIQNQYNMTPRIIFNEEKAVNLGDNNFITINEPRYVYKDFDINGSFPILNPETGEETGETGTHMQIYILLHSLYIQTAKEKDIQEAEHAAAMAAVPQ